MESPTVIRVRTDKDVHFTGALAQNAIARENIVLPASLASVAGTAKMTLRSISIQSDQNLDWEVFLFQTDLFEEADLDADSFAGRFLFAVAAGTQIAGAGQFYYHLGGLNTPYRDADGSGELHLALVNRNVTGKNAGATGEIVIELGFEPQ